MNIGVRVNTKHPFSIYRQTARLACMNICLKVYYCVVDKMKSTVIWKLFITFNSSLSAEVTLGSASEDADSRSPTRLRSKTEHNLINQAVILVTLQCALHSEAS